MTNLEAMVKGEKVGKSVLQRGGSEIKKGVKENKSNEGGFNNKRRCRPEQSKNSEKLTAS